MFGLMLALVPASANAQAAPPAQDIAKGFVDAATLVEGLVVDMRYLGADNFVGTKVDGYQAARCLLTRQAADALAKVARDIADKGLVLKVFDCYRPQRAVAHFVRWARDIDNRATKPTFYPQIDKQDLFKLGYIAERSGHSRGSTMDLTLARADGGELDMGSKFDFFGPISWPSSRSVSAEARANRMLLAGAMRQRGFVPYSREWWHFTLREEPFPNTYFDFPVR
ncbi:MAG: D-Ala-D-Ala dipeptidase [Xanthobacteraceae bacterium]|nr:D-Ala-D-Ala dipeptidase [Xanthobacteraceae bacterium]